MAENDRESQEGEDFSRYNLHQTKEEKDEAFTNYLHFVSSGRNVCRNVDPVRGRMVGIPNAEREVPGGIERLQGNHQRGDDLGGRIGPERYRRAWFYRK